MDGGKATLELRADGIVHLAWIRDVRIEEPDARAAMKAVDELCQEDSHPMLVDMETTEAVSRSARSVFSIPCAAGCGDPLLSGAFNGLLANFFLGVHTPPCPTRFFTSRNEATVWLLNPASVS
nr:STAS/SEC14 domain-containing protein [Arthrobacter sp. H41]